MFKRVDILRSPLRSCTKRVCRHGRWIRRNERSSRCSALANLSSVGSRCTSIRPARLMGLGWLGMKIFLSYPREQEPVARDVYNELRALGIDVFFDKESLQVGASWKRELETNIAKSDGAVVICSKETSRKTGELQSELRLILEAAKRRPFGRQYMIPIRVNGASLPAEISEFQYVDFESPGWKVAILRTLLSIANDIGDTKLSSNIKERIYILEGEGPIIKKDLKIKKRTLSVDIEYFKYTLNGMYYDFVNSRIESEALTPFYGFINGTNGWEVEGSARSELIVKIEEFFKDGDIISIRKYYVDYWSGAAHGSHFVSTLNFGGEDYGQIDIARLFGLDESNAISIIERCDSILDLQTRPLGSGDEEKLIGLSDFINPEWNTALDMIRQFNIDQRGITFNFGQATGMPYVAGEQEVLLPWSTWPFEPSDEFARTRLFKKIRMWRRGY